MANTKKYNVADSAIFNTNTEEPVNVKLSAGRPRNEKLVRDNSTQQGLTPDYTRVTFILRVELAEKLKDLAYTERLTIKDLMETVISEYLDVHVGNKELLHRPDNANRIRF